MRSSFKTHLISAHRLLRSIALAGAPAMLLIFFSTSSASAFSGRVHVASVNAAPGDAVGVGVYLGGNTDAFSSVRIPLRYNSADVTPDSISVAGSILDPAMAIIKSVDTDSGFFGVLVLPPFTPPIPTVSADTGLICTFWFTVSATAGPQVIRLDTLNTVDTISTLPFTLALRRIEFVDPTGLITYTPTFSPGFISLIVTDVNDDIIDPAIPKEFALKQNYPNPFNPSTKIGFALPERSTVTLDIYNVLGQRVVNLFTGELPVGNHEFEWDASDSPSGMYFYRLKSGLGVRTKKMILLK